MKRFLVILLLPLLIIWFSLIVASKEGLDLRNYEQPLTPLTAPTHEPESKTLAYVPPISMIEARLTEGNAGIKALSEARVPPSKKPPHAKRRPQIGSKDFWKTVKDELKKLPEGWIQFNPPKEMKVAIPERVEVRITKTLEDITKGLKGRGALEKQKVRVGPSMKVRLTSIGKTFDITTPSTEQQMVLDAGFTEWIFDVTPLKPGTQSLFLSVIVSLKIPGYQDEKKDVAVLERQIEVKVNWEEKIKSFFNMSGIIGGWIAIIVLIGGGLKRLKRLLKSGGSQEKNNKKERSGSEKAEKATNAI